MASLLTGNVITQNVVFSQLIDLIRNDEFAKKDVYLAFDVEANGPADHPKSRTLAVGVAVITQSCDIIYRTSLAILPSSDEPEDFWKSVSYALDDLQRGMRSAGNIVADFEKRFYAFSDEAFVDKAGDSWKNFMLVRNLEMYLKMMIKAQPEAEVRSSLVEMLTLLDTGRCASLRFVCDNPHFDFYFLRQLLKNAFEYDFVTYPIDTEEYARKQGRLGAYRYSDWPPTRGGVIDPDSYCMMYNLSQKWVDTAKFFRDRGTEIYRAQGSLHMPEVDAENVLRTVIALEFLSSRRGPSRGFLQIWAVITVILAIAFFLK